MTTELEEARAIACRLMLEAARYRDALERITKLDLSGNAAHIADVALMGYDVASEEEA
jgi:hypothetical protein